MSTRMAKLEIISADPFNILSSTKKVLENAKHVQIDESKIEQLSKLIGKRLEKGLDEDEYGLGLTGDYEKDAQLMLVQDAINFCFWAEKDQDKWKVEWPKGTIVSGGWYGVLAVFERTRTKKIPLLNAEYLACLTNKELGKIFESATETAIPLLQNRLNNLIEVGEVLQDKYDGQFINLLKKANFDAVKIVELVAEDFPSFRDVTTHNDENVYYLKRAQILANDLSYLKLTKGTKKITNLDQLSAFADYKIPQILRQFGVIEYSKSLAEKIDNMRLISAFSEEETEIRAATIWGVELVRQKLKKYRASEIDNAMWLVSQDQSKVEKPYHRTYTIFY